jgi:Arc/MetJ-type ribon-helix-helix transcriptional regulator
MKLAIRKTPVRTTIYLDPTIKAKIDEMVKRHLIKNQTDFINQSLEASIEEAGQELAMKNFAKMVDEIKPVKRKKTSEEMIRELREGRVQELIKKTYSSSKSTTKKTKNYEK